MKKDSFVFYTEWFQSIDELPPAVRLEVYDAIKVYVTTGKVPSDLSQLAKAVFSFIRRDLERTIEKYNAKCQRNREIAIEREKRKKDTTNVHERARTYTNVHERTPNDNDNDNDNDKHYNEFNKENSKKEKSNQDFIDEIYYLYPSKCPVRNISTGKCKKDKDRIEKLLGTYSQEEIKFVVKKEIEDKLGKFPLKNFSTFLNNFPDPNEIKQELQYPKSVEDVLDKDIKPTFPLFMDWIDEAGKNILAVNRKGFPTDIKQFNRMISVTIGGARTLAYVTLVLNRDGLGEYEDERGFMWTYLNYIKANGLYKG